MDGSSIPTRSTHAAALQFAKVRRLEWLALGGRRENSPRVKGMCLVKKGLREPSIGKKGQRRKSRAHAFVCIRRFRCHVTANANRRAADHLPFASFFLVVLA